MPSVLTTVISLFEVVNKKVCVAKKQFITQLFMQTRVFVLLLICNNVPKIL